MNRYIAVLLLGYALCASGCQESDATPPVVEDNERTLLLEAQADSLYRRTLDLEEENRLKHEFLEEYVTLINRTLRDLEAITEREGMIHQVRMEIRAGEASTSTMGTIEQQIQDNLATIERYVEESVKQRGELERQRAQLHRLARSRAVDVSSFEETIEKLNALIEEKEQTILRLRQEAEAMLVRIDDLEEEKTVLVEENTELREAYYIVGTRDELMDKAVIDRRGGFLNIGRKTRIDHLDATHFNAVTVETREIFVGEAVEKYQILTNHQANEVLYRFEEHEDGLHLHIADPEEFWKVSRYLIVEVKR